MSKSIYLIIIACIFSHALLSCKGKQGDPGPTGTNSTNSSPSFATMEGYAKCTAKGMGTDSSLFSVDMDFRGSNPADCYYIIRKSSTPNAPSQISIQITKLYSGQGNPFTGNSFITISLVFLGNDISEINQPGLQFIGTYVSAYGFATISPNKIKHVNGEDKNTISNLHYNTSTGILTGAFTIDYAGSSNAYAQYGSVFVTNGTFSSFLFNKID